VSDGYPGPDDRSPDDQPPVVDRDDVDSAVVGGLRIVPLRRRFLRSVLRIEEACYPRPWSATLFLSELAQRKGRRYMVATLGPLVVGYAGLMVIAEEGHVTTLTVDPAWHGHRIGTAMLLDMASAAPRLGVEHLTLEVRVGNASARALYHHFGFAPVGVRKNYYAETGEDAIVMWARDIRSDEYQRRLEEIGAQIGSRR
jgi:[ribosomal protein S18]-alanine N-acetyltransferase